ncbi:MAG: polyribonucleotide nucleotidyltransferase, partial [Candidatus Gracilibacteria bacterium]
MEEKAKTMTLGGREFKLTSGPIRTYAGGYVVASLGDTIVMANATVSEHAREGNDFFPMVVDYEENMYAAGKIKGSRFVKREGRPSENSVLISRLIDRPM